MLIFHPGGASEVQDGDDTYTADEDGRIDVPEDLGRSLINGPGFQPYLGEPELTEAELEESVTKTELMDRVIELEETVKDLKADLEKEKAKAAKPAPAKAAAKTEKAAAKAADEESKPS